MTQAERYFAALDAHNLPAQYALHLFRGMCAGKLPPRVPGMDTLIRLAWRIECGRTAEEAAAREYLYRWDLAILCMLNHLDDRYFSPFGEPHLIGL